VDPHTGELHEPMNAQKLDKRLRNGEHYSSLFELNT